MSQAGEGRMVPVPALEEKQIGFLCSRNYGPPVLRWELVAVLDLTFELGVQIVYDIMMGTWH